MNINMAINPHKLNFDRTEQNHSKPSKFVGSLIVISFVTVMVFGVRYLANPDTLPIKQVRIEGDFTHLSPVDLQLLVTDKVRGGFFNLDVDAVRIALLAEPWVHEVTVKRIWPDALRVIVTEQVPVVRWQVKGLLNSNGHHFQPDIESIPTKLPLLSGPKGSEVNVLNRFNLIQQRVQTIGFNIYSLQLDERRAWSFTIGNGIQVVLGRRDFEERFDRFLLLIPTTLSGRLDQADQIDMRYTNGFSIRWKK